MKICLHTFFTRFTYFWWCFKIWRHTGWETLVWNLLKGLWNSSLSLSWNIKLFISNLACRDRKAEPAGGQRDSGRRSACQRHLCGHADPAFRRNCSNDWNPSASHWNLLWTWKVNDRYRERVTEFDTIFIQYSEQKTPSFYVHSFFSFCNLFCTPCKDFVKSLEHVITPQLRGQIES